MDLEATIENIINILEKYRHLIDIPPTALYVNDNYMVIPEDWYDELRDVPYE